MCSLLLLPEDIILKVLYVSRVEDILSLETTCSFFRDVITSRHLWLVQLQLLDQPCAPHLPSSVHVEQLSYAELRAVVVKAIRANKTCMKGLLLSSDTQRDSITVETPLNAVDLSSHPTSLSTYLTPGGDYLFLVNLLEDYLEVFDVKTSDSIWTYSNSKRNVHMVEFCLEARLDVLPTFLVITRNWDRTKIIFEVFQLVNDYFLRLAVIENQHESDWRPCVKSSLNGAFAATTWSLNLVWSIIILNWSTGHINEVIFDCDHQVEYVQIVQDYLFYVLRTTQDQFVFGSFPLRQFSDTTRGSITNILDMDGCSLEVNAPEGFELWSVSPMSLFDASPTGRRIRKIKAVIILKLLSRGDGSLEYFDMANHFVLDIQDENSCSSGVLRSIRRSAPLEMPEVYSHQYGFRPEGFNNTITHSGRLLVEFHRWRRIDVTGQLVWTGRRTCLLGLDTQGELYYALFPAEYDQERHFSLDVFSGALIITRFDLEPMRIEIFYPA